MPTYYRNMNTSKIASGCVKAERFDSQADVEVNGGVVTGSPTFSDGRVYNDENTGKYITYRVPYLLTEEAQYNFHLDIKVFFDMDTVVNGFPIALGNRTAATLKGVQVYVNKASSELTVTYYHSGFAGLTSMVTSSVDFSIENDIQFRYTYSGGSGTAILYVNGVQKVIHTGLGLLIFDSDEVRVLNGRTSYTGYPLLGYVANLQIFSKGLQAEEITQLSDDKDLGYYGNSEITTAERASGLTFKQDFNEWSGVRRYGGVVFGTGSPTISDGSIISNGSSGIVYPRVYSPAKTLFMDFYAPIEIASGDAYYGILGNFDINVSGAGFILGYAFGTNYTFCFNKVAPLIGIKDTIPAGRNSIALVWDGSKYNVLLNGVSVTVYRSGSMSLYSTYQIAILSRGNALLFIPSGFKFYGVQVFSEALTNEEIAQLSEGKNLGYYGFR